MNNPIQLLQNLFKPRAKMVYHPFLPPHLRLDNNSTAAQWVIICKPNAFSKWFYYSDNNGNPFPFTKQYAAGLIKMIEEGKIVLITNGNYHNLRQITKNYEL